MMQMEVNVHQAEQGPLVDDAPVSGPQFCSNLKALRPPNCPTTSPPSSPGITTPGKPVWRANGCGTGGVADMAGDLLLQIIATQSYSGNLDEPYSGVSFLGACNSHDQCWASGNPRYVCDMEFRHAMNDACSALASPAAVNTCTGFAGQYHSAVSITNKSHSTYASSEAARRCALWAHDMRMNSCAN